MSRHPPGKDSLFATCGLSTLGVILLRKHRTLSLQRLGLPWTPELLSTPDTKADAYLF